MAGVALAGIVLAVLGLLADLSPFCFVAIGGTW